MGEPIMVLERVAENPIVSRADIPDVPPEVSDPSAVFNPGATAYADGYLLLLRVQTRSRETFFMRAVSQDGVRFDIEPRIVPVRGLERVAGAVYHAYDPRITRLDGRYYVVFAADTDFGCRLAVAGTDDFTSLDLMGLGDGDDIRNGVLFPDRVDGSYARLDRPNKLRFEGGSTSGDEIVYSRSDDLVTWRPVTSVMRGRLHYWDELIGPGPPPVRTRDGWLLVYHGIATRFAGVNIYQAGVALLDLADPGKLVARGRGNVLEPREDYETTGQVPNVVFPTGLVVDDFDEDGFARPESRALLYYGAADTSVCLAKTTVGDLLEACR
jgi:beta-1,4-mannooligosaccharide/beta-1,4-mannosyl-N-acetylglucosamine phosphorylase